MALGTNDTLNASYLADQLNGEIVLESFFLHAVLQDKAQRQEKLSVPHHTFQIHRLDEAMRERNYRMVGTGQEMWGHACDRCMRIFKGADGHWCESLPIVFSNSC